MASPVTRRLLILLLPFVLLGGLTGCGGSSQEVEKTPDLGDLKQQLQFVAKEGSTGSALMSLQTVIESIKDSHPDLYTKLEEKFQVLWNSEDKEENKKIAQEMLEIVNSNSSA